jgi:hypothetical protein
MMILIGVYSALALLVDGLYRADLGDHWRAAMEITAAGIVILLTIALAP